MNMDSTFTYLAVIGFAMISLIFANGMFTPWIIVSLVALIALAVMPDSEDLRQNQQQK